MKKSFLIALVTALILSATPARAKEFSSDFSFEKYDFFTELKLPVVNENSYTKEISVGITVINGQPYLRNDYTNDFVLFDEPLYIALAEKTGTYSWECIRAGDLYMARKTDIDGIPNKLMYEKP